MHKQVLWLIPAVLAACLTAWLVGCAATPAPASGYFIHQSAAGANCRSCHPDLKADQKPAMHDDRFLRRHASYSHDPTCAFCHGRNACASCHPQKKDEPPKAPDPRRLIPRR
ncbi:MAG: hypothetical protein GX444_12060 [Myxococcales bacterium]|nr:hypothetical protein [Myxococcales bacterium]